MKKLVIFDLDGTLLDTIHDLADATNHALETLGFNTYPVSAYNQMVGNGIAKLLERALPAGERTPERQKEMRKAFLDYYGRNLCVHTRPYPGIAELLEQLTSRGINIAVASNKYQRGVDTLIRHYFGNYPWAAVCGQREGVPVKPDPSIVFNILGQCPTSKQEVLYCGDSGVDMQTAYRAGVTSCGVTWGFRSRAELEENNANILVDNPLEILDLVIE